MHMTYHVYAVANEDYFFRFPSKHLGRIVLGLRLFKGQRFFNQVYTC